MKSVAYKLTSPAGKSYIGITKKTAQQRWQQHVSLSRQGRTTPLHAAIRKYGADGFKIEVIVQADWSYLLDLEPKLIVLYDTRCSSGYNVTSGGARCDANTGKRFSAEWRKNMSEAHIRRCARMTPEQRSALAKKSHINSDPDRARRASKRMKELHADPEWRADWLRKLRAGKAKGSR